MLHGHFRWKAIFVLVVTLASVGVGWYFLHDYQVRAMNGHFLELAARDENDNRLDRAARFLRQYLLVQRDDVDARARYGVLEEKLAQTPRARGKALGIYEQVLEQDANRRDIRLRAAKLCMSLGRIDDALRHLTFLKDVDSSDPEIEILNGDCKTFRKEADQKKLQAQWAKAEEHYREAIRRSPGKVEAYERLAFLLKSKQKRPVDATQVLEDLIGANPETVGAYLIRARLRQSGIEDVVESLPAKAASAASLAATPLGCGACLSAPIALAPKAGIDLFGAGQDLARARELAPKKVDVLLASSGHALLLAARQGEKAPHRHFEQARSFLRDIDKNDKNNQRVLPQLAAVEIAAGNTDEAIKILRTAQKEARGAERNRLLWQLASLLIDTDQLMEANDMIEELRKGYESGARLNFLRARIAIANGEWRLASEKLETARPLLEDSPSLVLQADILLGACFEQLGNSEQQLSVYRRARRLDPLHPAPRLALAKALASLGRLEEAVEECNDLRPLPHSIEADLLYAKLLIAKVHRFPSALRNGDEAEQLLNQIEAHDKTKERDVTLLRAELRAAQNKIDEAKKILKNAKSDAIELRLALANLATNPAEATKILDQAEKDFQTPKDRAELRLAKLRYVPDKKEDARKYLDALGANLGDSKDVERGRLLAGLAVAYERAGYAPQAEQFWLKLVKLQKNQLRVLESMFDFYLRIQDPDGMENTLKSIENIEGKGGPFGHYGQAQLLIFELRKSAELSDKEKKLKAAAALQHLQTAAAMRPRWPRVPLSLANIAELEGKSEEMFKNLRDAVELGNRQVSVIRALVYKYGENKQHAEAEEMLQKLKEVQPDFGVDLKMREAELSLPRDPKRALELTLKAIPKDSKNHKEHEWQGQMLGILGMTKEAEAALKEARNFAKGEPSPWIALVQLYARNGDTKRAQEIIEEMQKKITPGKLLFAQADCYRILGDAEKAEKQYRRAYDSTTTTAEKSAVLKNLAELHMSSGKSKEAEIVLGEMLNLDIDAELRFWVRRNLALAEGFQGDPEKLQKAMDIIQENINADPSRIEDQIVMALLLVHKPEKRGTAIEILEKARKTRPLAVHPQFVLANLYEAENNWVKSRREYRDLLNANPDHPRYRGYLAVYVDKLLLHDDREEAESWFAPLENSIRSFLKEKQTKSSLPRLERLRRAANLLGDLARRHPFMTERIVARNEPMLRAEAKAIGGYESRLAVADFLAVCGKLDEALKLCDEVYRELPKQGNTSPQNVIDVAIVALSNGLPEEQQFKLVEKWVADGRQDDIDAERQKEKGFERWDFYAAALKERNGEYPEAERLYRAVLESDEGVRAMNNLAFLLALQKEKGDESLKLIETVIAKVGTQAEILDTRAVIQMARGKLADAQKDIKQALDQERTPYRLFHLAQIHQAAGRTKEAAAVFEEANRLGLREASLHPRERDRYYRMNDAAKKNETKKAR